MRLEAVTAELRPRSDWEAVDLGLALARRDFGRLLGIWWLGMLPLLLPLGFLLREHPLWLAAALWWWTPVSSRLVLFHLSRRLFGDRPGWREVLRELPRAVVRRFFFRMVWARFSPWRPLTMAVEDLEGLRGAAYGQRVRLLLRRGDATVIMLALWRAALVFWLALALLMTAALFLPEGQGEHWQEAMRNWWDGHWEEAPPSFGWLAALSLLLAMSLTDVFATGAGFGIYVNHRTWIEGWDVELAFRRLANRLKGIAGALVAGVLLMPAAGPASAGAQEAVEVERVEEVDEDDPARVAAGVKEHKDFEVHKVKVRVPRSSRPPMWNEAFVRFLMTMGAVLFWVVVAAAVGFIGWLIWRYRHVFRGGGAKRGRAPAVVPRVVMGLDVAPESMPGDIPGAALELWRVGRRQEAMSLLYRGTISKLIATGNVEIEESDTESDCLRRVRTGAEVHAGYFSGLTDAWMRLAYARLTPADPEMEALCTTWPFAERRVG